MVRMARVFVFGVVGDGLVGVGFFFGFARRSRDRCVVFLFFVGACGGVGSWGSPRPG